MSIKPSLSIRLVRLGVGLTCLLALFGLLATGPLPPGATGDVIERNRQQDTQATALFYMDLESMPELESRLDMLRNEPIPRAAMPACH
jgi:hypothetical protein